MPKDLPDSNQYFVSIVSIVDYACNDDSQDFTIGHEILGIPGYEVTIISILVLIAVISLSLKIRTKIIISKTLGSW